MLLWLFQQWALTSLSFPARTVSSAKMPLLFHTLKIVLFHRVRPPPDPDSDRTDELMDKLKSANMLMFYILREYFFLLTLINILSATECALPVYYCLFWKLIRLFVVPIFFLFALRNTVIHNVNRFFCTFWFWYPKENWTILKLINNFIRNYGLEPNSTIPITSW